jgi:hypothetical protein
MSTRLLFALVSSAILAMVSQSNATTITGSYTAVDTGTGNYLPTINADGGPFLSSPFSESLTLGSMTAPTTFLQVAPVSGNSSVGTQTGAIAVAMKLTGPSNSPVTSFSYTAGGDPVTLTNGTLNLTANYGIFYGNQTDCIAWNTTNCTSTDNTTTIGETVTATFADGAVVAINLYNWSDWNMAPNISFTLVTDVGGSPVPEPASLMLFGAGLIGLSMARRFRRRQTMPVGSLITA